MTTFGSRNSFSSRFYREEYRLIIPRSDSSNSITIPGFYDVVNRNRMNPNRPIAWPEDPDDPGQPLRATNLIPMGPGDSLTLLVGGDAPDGAVITTFTVTRIDPVVNAMGQVIAFVERVTGSASAARTNSTSPFRFANLAADELEDIEVGDTNAGIWTLLAGDMTFLGDAASPANLFINGDQAAFLRVYSSVGGWDARWCYGARSQGQSKPVWR